jgi:hypothetical protein
MNITIIHEVFVRSAHWKNMPKLKAKTPIQQLLRYKIKRIMLKKKRRRNSRENQDGKPDKIRPEENDLIQATIKNK